jgi:hypothetical protein
VPTNVASSSRPRNRHPTNSAPLLEDALGEAAAGEVDVDVVQQEANPRGVDLHHRIAGLELAAPTARPCDRPTVVERHVTRRESARHDGPSERRPRRPRLHAQMMTGRRRLHPDVPRHDLPMPVVQNLARPTAVQLAACRRSVEELDRLCSFRMLSGEDHLDLDWSPGALRRLGDLIPLPPGVPEAIRHALSGGDEVNPAYRDTVDTIFEHPVTAWEPPDAARVADVLAGLDARRLAAGFPHRRVVAERLLLDPRMRDPGGYVLSHLTALRSFYLGARDRGLAVVLWWD